MHQTKYRGIITKSRVIDVYSLGTGLPAGKEKKTAAGDDIHKDEEPGLYA